MYSDDHIKATVCKVEINDAYGIDQWFQCDQSTNTSETKLSYEQLFYQFLTLFQATICKKKSASTEEASVMSV